ncbi:uncharacterized protein LOC100826462 [Brachypodium distachyon]|uniref:Uncharacterized protein n=1 Tax=Brachypodium distachyon TaxID=15368 RepID=I1IE47_BRADI|nr:uncharacterized protein LOC100826462 [Brachypodium distachyon]KQK01445.1 hypothetical protein BRADI_3g55880v3 [Brachypodium distachyon]PNT69460.1 hypothetical protein BRADI_3g55880v3 [Brachypodium distachyon]|eukprot:XP_003572968.1 uncharacterized protein LOC100826462 [Brachypodium distachyon]
MAKLPAVLHTPRPSSLRPAPIAAARTSSDPPTLLAPTSIPRADLSKAAAAVSTNRSSAGSSSSSTTRDLGSVAKAAAKRLAYDDGFAFPTAASTPPPPELAPEDLAPLLDLPDPDDAASSSSVVSASPAHAMAASADSTVTEVAAVADSEQAPPFPLTEMELVIAELRGARGLTPRTKRLVDALVEVAAAELDPNPTAAALRLRRAGFWRKLRVGVLATTVFAVAAMDVALAIALFASRGGSSGNYQYHGLPPT